MSMTITPAHVLALVIAWMIIEPGALFTVDVRTFKIQWNLSTFAANVMPHAFLTILVWTLIVFAANRTQASAAAANAENAYVRPPNEVDGAAPAPSGKTVME